MPVEGNATIVLSIVGIVLVAAVLGAGALRNGLRRDRGAFMASIAAAIVAALWALFYVAIAQPTHNHHAILFAVLAVAALVLAALTRPQMTAPAA